MPAEEEKKVKLATLNEHISCCICKGYLIEATTIIECLHTFCKVCIVKHLKRTNTCPKCKQVVHQSHPLNYISFDRTMQNIVLKLVPGLERLTEQANNNNNNTSNNNNNTTANNNNNFNNNTTTNAASNGGQLLSGKDGGAKSISATTSDANKLKPIDINGRQQSAGQYNDYHRNDEQINLHITPNPTYDQMKTLKRAFVRVSCLATVTHLKKFIALKLCDDVEKYREFDLLCNDHLLGNDHNFKFVSVTQWRNKVPPVKITYRPRVEN